MPEMTLAEAATFLGCSATTLRHQRERGKIRARLVGKTYVVDTREVDRYRAASRGKRQPEGDVSYADPCMCHTAADHANGQRLQREMRVRYRIPAIECVGCVLGDDGPSMHDYGYGCAYGKGAVL